MHRGKARGYCSDDRLGCQCTAGLGLRCAVIGAWAERSGERAPPGAAPGYPPLIGACASSRRGTALSIATATPCSRRQPPVTPDPVDPCGKAAGVAALWCVASGDRLPYPDVVHAMSPHPLHCRLGFKCDEACSTQATFTSRPRYEHIQPHWWKAAVRLIPQTGRDIKNAMLHPGALHSECVPGDIRGCARSSPQASANIVTMRGRAHRTRDARGGCACLAACTHP